MAGWTHHTGQAVALLHDNIDTDQLIPARFMSTPRSEGYGRFLLHDMRRTGADLDPGFPLNRHPMASVLVAGRNFGSGSSREAAVYALLDAGFKAVIAPSFGDIFAGNAVNNGLLPAQVADIEPVVATLSEGMAEVEIDLASGVIRIAGTTLPFALDDTWRTKLIKGWDDIDLTLQHAAQIDAFRQERRRTAPEAQPWAK